MWLEEYELLFLKCFTKICITKILIFLYFLFIPYLVK
jgi:hypothetical protein